MKKKKFFAQIFRQKQLWYTFLFVHLLKYKIQMKYGVKVLNFIRPNYNLNKIQFRNII